MLAVDPYSCEIHNDHALHLECDACESESAMEI
jgi:hypothetical protein